MPKAKQKSANRIRLNKAERERREYVPPDVTAFVGQSFRPRRLDTQGPHSNENFYIETPLEFPF